MQWSYVFLALTHRYLCLSASSFIRLVGLQVNYPHCPLALRDDLDEPTISHDSELMNSTEIILLDGANETCLPSFDVNRRLWLVEFDVIVPENDHTDMLIQVVTKEFPCRQPMMTILVNRILKDASRGQLLECIPQTVPEDMAGALKKCLFLCTQITPDVEGHINIFLRVESFPFPQTNFENQSICGFSVQFR